MEQHIQFLEKAIAIASENINSGGGPFGAIIVKDGEIVASSGNSVTLDNDPTAHAEINAIRKACKALNTFDLTGCVIYSSCEPCPMCLSAIYWSRIDEVYFAGTKHDAKDAGFDDSFIYDELALPNHKKHISLKHINLQNATFPFENWRNFENKINY